MRQASREAELTLDWEGHVEGVLVRSGPCELADYVERAAAVWHYAAHVGDSQYRPIRVTFNPADARQPDPGEPRSARLFETG
jgi:hypothetical protein